MLLKVKGLVVKSIDVGESDKYLSILTEEHGKIFCRARGVRNIKSKYIVATQLFVYSEFTLLQTNNFTKMNEAVVIEGFYNIRTDIEKLTLATYLVDIAQELSSEAVGNEGILYLTLHALYVLAQEIQPNYIIKGVYELRAMSVAGFMPELSSCVKCGGSTGEPLRFDLLEGGVICSQCSSKYHQDDFPRFVCSIGTETYKALSFVLQARNDRIFSFNLTGSARSEFSAVCERFTLTQIGHGFATLDFHKKVTSEPE